MRTAVVASIAIAAAAGVATFIALRDRAGEAPPAEFLEPLAESPRPPVVAEPTRPLLEAHPAPPTAAASPAARAARATRAALVEDRNARAREHREAVARYEAGVVTISEVEQAEMRLLDARHRLGELDGPAWHRARAVLAEREAQWAELRYAAGVMPIDEKERASLALELERFLAGDANTYALSRQRFLADSTARQTARAEAGLVSPKSNEEEYARLVESFPDADVAKERDR